MNNSVSTTKSNKILIAAVVFLAIISVGLGIALYFNNNSMQGHATSLENIYQRSFYELVDNVNSIEVEVSKLLVTNDSISQQKSLNTIKQQTADAQNNLSSLPIKSNVVSTTTKFVNQLNGYCTSLLNYNNAKLTDKDYETIQKAYDCIAMIKYELNNISNKINQGYSILDNLDGDVDVDAFGENFEQINNDSIEYPSMIYDGPFSDSVLNKQIKGLENKEYTSDRAQEYISQVFGVQKTSLIEYLGQTQGKFVTYDFKLTTKDYKVYYLQITKQGKFLLNLTAQSSVGGGVLDIDQAKTKAVDFAKSLNLDLKPVWSANANGIAYINLAPVVDQVIIYPDLIKVKVDMSNGDIVGWEASSYAYNHTKRPIPQAQITQQQALELVSNKLKILSTKLCIIPLEYTGEALAYEITAEFNSFTYYLYLDANTGEQIKVMRVIETSEGELLL